MSAGVIAAHYVASSAPAGPTRFYLEASGDGPLGVAPSYDALWDDTDIAGRMLWDSVQRKTPLANYAGNSSALAAAGSALHRQFISRPLTAQTISGTVKGIIRGAEANAGANMHTQLILKVVSADGSTVRGTLLAADLGGLVSELSTSHTTRKIPQAWSSPGATLTSVDAQDGDYLVAEVGAEKTASTGGNSYWATYLFGSDGASDFAEDETQTTTLNPWLEFSDGIEFKTGTPTLVGTPSITPVNNAGTQDITMPSVDAGDVIVLVPAHAGTVSSVSGGFTLDVAATGSNLNGAVYVKKCDGSEDGSTVTVTFSAAGYGAVALFHVRGTDGIATRGTYRATSNLASFTATAEGCKTGDLLLYAGAVRSNSVTVLTMTGGGTQDDSDSINVLRGMVIGHGTADTAAEPQTWASSVTGGTSPAQFGVVLAMMPD